MKSKLPGAQMTMDVIWAQCGSFVAIAVLSKVGVGMAVAVVAVDRVEKVVEAGALLKVVIGTATGQC